MSKKEIIEDINKAIDQYQEKGLMADVFFLLNIRNRIENELEDKVSEDKKRKLLEVKNG